MQFIIDNYVWFIVGLLLLIMAVIGYFADKSDFGRKEFQKRIKQPKEQNKTSKKEKVEEIFPDEVPIKIPDDASVENVVSEESVISEDLFQILPSETIHESVNTNEDLYQPLESNLTEDLYQPLESDSTEDLYQPLESNLTEDLYQPLENSEQPVDNSDLFKPLDEIIDEPNLDSENDVNATQDNAEQQENVGSITDTEEDIWKF